MIRENEFRISRRPYAADLSSLRVRERNGYQGRTCYPSTVTAVWFRRKSGVTTASIGELRESQDKPPADAAEFLRIHTDGRYGGDCHGRWDGSRYWGAQEPAVIAQHLELLRPMLAGYPDIPPGYGLVEILLTSFTCLKAGDSSPHGMGFLFHWRLPAPLARLGSYTASAGV